MMQPHDQQTEREESRADPDLQARNLCKFMQIAFPGTQFRIRDGKGGESSNKALPEAGR